MNVALHRAGRSTAVRVIAWREAKAAMRGLGGYVALSAALLAAGWVLSIDVRALMAAGVLVVAHPFGLPLAAALLVLASFLAVLAAMSAARERESGTLEVLFYAPVDELSYVLGKVGGLLIAYIAGLPLLLASLALLSLMTGFAMTPMVLASLAFSIVPAAEIISFGVLLSVGTRRVRSAVLLLVGVSAILLGVTMAYRVVLLVPISDPSSPVLALRDALEALNLALSWVSPFASLERIVDGAVSGAWRVALLNLSAAIACTAAMIGLAAYWLRHVGVHRRAE